MDPQAPYHPEQVVNTEPRAEGQPPKNNHWITILSVGLFVLFSLAAVAFLYYQNQQLKKMLANYQVQPSPTPSVTPNPTADWKTYTGSKYSFKYPQDWLKNSGSSADVALKSPDEKMSLSLSMGLTAFGVECEQTLKEENINLSGVIVQRITYMGVTDELCGDTSKTRSISISIKNGNKTDTFDFRYDSSNISQAETIFDQILSTFKFIQ